jgi:membrane carboxypeptidase/penicillin-binding protein
LQVRSTLNPRLQDIAVRPARRLLAYDRRHGFRAPLKHVELKDDWMAAPGHTDKSGVTTGASVVTELRTMPPWFAGRRSGKIPGELNWARLKAGDIVMSNR